MVFSLINVQKQTGRRVEGNWLQDHIGTLATATERARHTERMNSNAITVAVVAAVNSPVAILSYWENLERLDLT